MKNFKKLALIAATAVVFSASAHADGQWGSSIILNNLEKLGGADADFNGVAAVFQASESFTTEYKTQRDVVNAAQKALDDSALVNQFGTFNTFGDFSGDTSAPAPTIQSFVDTITTELGTLKGMRSTEVDTAKVVEKLFAAGGVFTLAIEAKLLEFSANGLAISNQIANLSKNIVSDITLDGVISGDTQLEIESIDTAIAHIKSQASLLTDTDGTGDYLGQDFVGGAVSYTAANGVTEVSYIETAEGEWQLDGTGTVIDNDAINTQLRAAGLSNQSVYFGTPANSVALLRTANSIGAGSTQIVFDFGTSTYGNQIAAVASLSDLQIFSGVGDVATDFTFTLSGNEVLLDAAPVIVDRSASINPPTT